MTPEDVLRVVVRALEAAEIPYMLTGSFASAYHATPRATQDIDLVISPTREALRALVAAFPHDRYYAEESAALDALEREGQFNVIDIETGWKVDFIIRRSRPFSRTEFDRRQQVDLGGVPLFIASAEDLVIAKLEWAKAGGSERQLEDAASVLRMRGREVDMIYIGRWVQELGLQDQWDRVSKG